MKRFIVVYYSKTGNTERAAQDIAAGLNADVEKIKDLRKRNGFFRFFTSGRDALKKRLTEIAPPEKDAAGYDLTVIGTPVWAGNMAPAVRTYITQNKGRLKNVAFLVTSGGSSTDKVAASMAELCGKKAAASLGLVAKELKNEKTYSEKVSAFVAEVKK